jgi:hypothetical protein
MPCTEQCPSEMRFRSKANRLLICTHVCAQLAAGFSMLGSAPKTPSRPNSQRKCANLLQDTARGIMCARYVELGGFSPTTRGLPFTEATRFNGQV